MGMLYAHCISTEFDSKDINIKIIRQNTNTESAPKELGLQIRTQNVVLYFKEKNTLINPLNQNVFCLYLIQLRPMVISIIHIQCSFFVCASNT